MGVQQNREILCPVEYWVKAKVLGTSLKGEESAEGANVGGR